ncbi:hypothetical protein MACK_002492 [Theileria orientalis]|uniref:Uncharacterized protein n=1 Tax=Theileria orientalis TaxID=68886 RepID=A0A976MEY8_THEOR|nr:hypothetical protein MACK_002492 [Theileria orientalis]
MNSYPMGPIKPKPPKPPDPSQLEYEPYGHILNVSLIKVNFEDKRTSDKITYEYNSKTNTHSFIANKGYLFDGAVEGSTTLWDCTPGRYADRINTTQHSNDRRSIKVFIPLEPESEESEVEFEGSSDTKIAKIYDTQNQTSKRLFSYDTTEVYPDMPGQARRDSDRHNHITGHDYEIMEIEGDGIKQVEHESKVQSETPTVIEIQDTLPKPKQKSEPAREPELYLVTLDVKIKENTSKVKYEYDQEHRIHTFTPLPGFLIDRVVKGSYQIWECKNGVYPEKVLILPNEEGEMVVRIYYPSHVQIQSDSDFEFVPSSHSLGRVVSDPSRVYDPTPKPIPMDLYTPPGRLHKSPEKPMYSLDVDQMDSTYLSRALKTVEATRTVSVDPYTDTDIPQHKIPVDLTIDFRWNTFLFDYSKLNNVATYTPKEGYAFGKVKLFSGYYSRGSDLVLWETEFPEKFANKVVVIEHSKIILYLDNATTVVFKKGFNNLWIQDEYAFDGSGLDWDYQYIRLDINFKRTTEVYKVTKHYHDSNIYEYVYVPKNGYKFSVVKQAGQIVWSISDQNRYATKVSVVRFSSHFTEVIIGLVDGTSLIYVKKTSGTFKKISFGD